MNHVSKSKVNNMYERQPCGGTTRMRHVWVNNNELKVNNMCGRTTRMNDNPGGEQHI